MINLSYRLQCTIGFASIVFFTIGCSPPSTGTPGPAPNAPEIVYDGVIFPDSVLAVPGGFDGTASGEVLYFPEDNRLRVISVDDIVIGQMADDADIVIDNFAATGSIWTVDGNKDLNGRICTYPDGSGGLNFIMGEDSNQPTTLAGWGVFDKTGEQIGKLTATYHVDTPEPEPHGCAIDQNGRLFVSEVGIQEVGNVTGQLIVFFPPFEHFPGPPGDYPDTGASSTNFCKIYTDIGTAGQVATDADGNVYVAMGRSENAIHGGKILKFSPPWPTSTAECTSTDSTGAPLFAKTPEIFISDSRFFTPTGIVQTPTGNWYVSSVLNGAIGEFGPDGIFLQYILAPPAGAFPSDADLPLSTGHPQGLELDSSGTLYYADLALDGALPDIQPLETGIAKIFRITFN